MVCRIGLSRAQPHVERSQFLISRGYASKSTHLEPKKSVQSYQWANETLPLPHQSEYQALRNNLKHLVQKNLPPISDSFITVSKREVQTKRNESRVEESKRISHVPPESIKEIRKECEDLKRLIENRDEEIKLKVEKLFQKLNTI